MSYDKTIINALKCWVGKRISALDSKINGIPKPTWEALPDKPFGERKVEITWDGKPESAEVYGGVLYRVSDLTPTADILIGGTLTAKSATTGGPVEDIRIAPETIGTTDFGGIDICTMCMVIPAGGIVITNDEVGTLELPGGIYFSKMYEDPDIYGGCLSYTEVKQIEERYLPSGGNGGAGVPKLFLTWDEDEYVDVQKKEGGASFDEIATAIENGIYPEVIMIHNGERYLKCVQIDYYDRNNWLGFSFCITSNVPMESFVIYMKPDSSIFID